MWFLFSVLTAFFESVKDVYSKKSLKKIDEYVVAWSIRVFALPFLFIPLLFTGIPALKDNFWMALLVGGILNVVATVLYMKALKYSDLSICVPMVTFTPVFLLLTSPVGGETWAVDSTHDITWDNIGTIKFVRLEYSTDNRSSWDTIKASLPNSGVYPWVIPDAISEQCRVRISDVDDPECSDTSDNNFKIY